MNSEMTRKFYKPDMATRRHLNLGIDEYHYCQHGKDLDQECSQCSDLSCMGMVSTWMPPKVDYRGKIHLWPA